jgi:Wiskott-Aldrich syndrome protein
MVGFSFPNEGEALTMYKKFEKRNKLSTGGMDSLARDPRVRSDDMFDTGKAKAQPATPSTPARSKTKSKKGKIDKSLISAPSGFHHVAHMGYDAEGGFTSTGLDPSWQALLENLGQYGVSKNDLQGNEDFIRGFVEEYRAQASVTYANLIC